MKAFADIFSTLGRRLGSFGGDETTRRVIADACRENEWFTETDILRSVEAIRSRMLDGRCIGQWLAHYPALGRQRPRRRVAIVMAGNIPLVGFFDMMCVLAAGHVPYVKYSSKDSVLMQYVAGALHEIEPALDIEQYSSQHPVDAAIATGGESANIHFRNAFSGLPVLLRGNRHSAAVLDGSESDSQMEALADDVFAYSGLGCRSVSLIFIPRGCSLRLPARPMCLGYRNNALRCRALLTMTGVPFTALGEGVAVCGEPSFPRELSRINVSEYDSPAQVEAWLAANDSRLQCVVSARKIHPRTVGFGCAQSPALTDYPDDADVMAFLLNLA